jgi:PAS domain S-box-containing protein
MAHKNYIPMMFIIMAAAISSGCTVKDSIDISKGWKLIRGDGPGYMRPGIDDSAWLTVNLPGRVIKEKKQQVYWLRKSVVIPKTYSNEDLAVYLGKIWDVEETYCNGYKIGATGRLYPNFNSAWFWDRYYYIPPRIIKYDAVNVLSIRVFTNQIAFFNGKPFIADLESVRVFNFFQRFKAEYIPMGLGMLTLVLGLFALFQFITNRRQRETLLLAVTLLLWSVLSTHHYIPDYLIIDFNTQDKLYMALIAIELVLVIFLFQMELNLWSRPLTIITCINGFAAVVVAMTATARDPITGWRFDVLGVMGIIGQIVALIFMIKMFKRRTRERMVIFVSYLFFITCVLHDSLAISSVIPYEFFWINMAYPALIIGIGIVFVQRASFVAREFERAGIEIKMRKESEDVLRRSEERYRTILETMHEGLFEHDLKGNYTYVNDAGCKLQGYQSDELIGVNYWSLFPHETVQFFFEVYHRIYESGKPELLMDYEVKFKDGSIRIHQANVELIRDSSGQPMGFRTLAWDVTERKKMEKEKAELEEQLVQAQKMESVGRLAGGVAHDFNNMLSVILGYAELIKLRLPRYDPLLKDVLEIERAAARSRDLTVQLLAFSRKQVITPLLVDLNDLVMNMKKTLSRLIGEDVDLQFYPGRDLWKIKFDLSQMQQVLINLTTNARDAMPGGGKLTVETANIYLNEAYCKMHLGFSPGYYVLLGVSDDGTGMDKETLQHLFEPFFTTKEPGRGTGLGLATVYGIVRQNGGFINVYSEPGKGTTFKIYIPRSLEEGDIQKEAKEESVASGSGTVLLVEDDDMVRRMTSEMLEAIGYTVTASGSPAEAESLCENQDLHIDLLITDVVMPGMSGKELRDRIQVKRPGMKVLFMSGYTSNVIVHRGVLEEGVHFLQKPFSMNDLAGKIREAMSGK